MSPVEAKHRAEAERLYRQISKLYGDRAGLMARAEEVSIEIRQLEEAAAAADEAAYQASRRVPAKLLEIVP